jgi:hypothetical protein
VRIRFLILVKFFFHLIQESSSFFIIRKPTRHKGMKVRTGPRNINWLRVIYSGKNILKIVQY